MEINNLQTTCRFKALIIGIGICGIYVNSTIVNEGVKVKTSPLYDWGPFPSNYTSSH